MGSGRVGPYDCLAVARDRCDAALAHVASFVAPALAHPAENPTDHE